MRQIKYIVVHCTATPVDTSVESILRYWREVKEWKNPGYHFIVMRNGAIRQLLPIDKIANGVAGHNYSSIHISYIGGIDEKGRSLDNRTEAQKEALWKKLKTLKKMFPAAKIQGHRDFEGVTKACPSFNAKSEYCSLSFDAAKEYSIIK